MLGEKAIHTTPSVTFLTYFGFRDLSICGKLTELLGEVKCLHTCSHDGNNLYQSSDVQNRSLLPVGMDCPFSVLKHSWLLIPTEYDLLTFTQTKHSSRFQ